MIQSTGTDYDIHKIVHDLSFHPKIRTQRFLELPLEIRAITFLNLGKLTLRDLLAQLTNEQTIEVLEQLDPDQATDVMALVPTSRKSRILKKLTTELQEGIELLSKFDPQSAAGLMHVDYIQVDVNAKGLQVAQRCKDHEKRTGRLPTILAMRKNKLVGFLPGHALGFAQGTTTIKSFIRPIPFVSYDASHQTVIQLFRKHPHTQIVVSGKNDDVIGVIYSDDVLRLMAKHTSSSLYQFAGVHQEETVSDPVRVKVASRYKWLIINLGTAFLASLTVTQFNETIAESVFLVAFMPIVAGMGGNAGTQTLAILVRGIALNQIELKTAWPTLRREIGTGVLDGLLIGFILAVIVILFYGDIKLALVLGSALIFNLIIAACFGTMVPLIMKRLGKDPATSASVFITTATDVLGFTAFLGLASLVL